MMNAHNRMIDKLKAIGEELAWYGVATRAEIWPQNLSGRLPVLVMEVEDLRMAIDHLNALKVRTIAGQYLTDLPFPDQANARYMVFEHPLVGRIVMSMDPAVCDSCRHSGKPIVIAPVNNKFN